ncbi:hypothetical protein [Streptomyces sp. 2P-4]|uniref:hypothetical protein n=1 Tax=Streptomyces sp. 2P-4 TaxID=2931974 RepID=UPI0025415B20|nr:hypothetical protein [Streptomyces sp. 2P-4]
MASASATAPAPSTSRQLVAAARYTAVEGPTGPQGPAGPQGEVDPEEPQPPLGAAGAGAGVALRSTDARTRTVHAASHASAGSDPVTPAAIGAETQAGLTAQVSGIVRRRIARLPRDTAARYVPLLSILAAVKTADEQVTSNIVLQDDDHLALTVAAGATYALDAYLDVEADPAADITLGWSAPAGATLPWTESGISAGNAGNIGSIKQSRGPGDLVRRRHHLYRLRCAPGRGPQDRWHARDSATAVGPIGFVRHADDAEGWLLDPSHPHQMTLPPLGLPWVPSIPATPWSPGCCGDRWNPSTDDGVSLPGRASPPELPGCEQRESGARGESRRPCSFCTLTR